MLRGARETAMASDQALEASSATLDDEAYDPFDAFDRAMGADTCRDPYPELAAARRRAPVRRLDLRAMLGEAFENLAGKMPEHYQALSHEAVSQVLRDAQTFSSAAYKDSIGVVMGPTILVMDAPEHARYRGLVQMAFLEKALARWESELVSPVVHGLIDRFAGRGRADLVRELTFPFPVSVIAGLLGLPEQDLPRFHRWTVALISVAFDWQKGIAASQRLAGYLRPIIAERRAHPREDVISVLARAELDGHRLDDEQILASCACCSPPAPRRPTAPPATCCSACSPVRSSSRRCAPTARSSPRRWRRACAGRRPSPGSAACAPGRPRSAACASRRAR
jgi:cytochrome P450